MKNYQKVGINVFLTLLVDNYLTTRLQNSNFAKGICRVGLMPKIVNPEYRNFTETGLINTIKPDEFAKMLEKIEYIRIEEAKGLAALIYLTGCRPSEAIELQKGMVEITKKFLKITLPTKKRGRARLILLERNKISEKIVTQAQNTVFPHNYLFYNFITRGEQKQFVKFKLKNGEEKIKEYERLNTKIYYHFKKWFNLPPYFFRHNRFSRMAEEGAPFPTIAHVKGTIKLESIAPYIHLSLDAAKKAKKYLR